MIEVRIHGRGGQGNVVAAYLLAGAAIGEGWHALAFPAFGAERRGAPVAAFVRMDEHPFRRRNQIAHPDYLIVQDEALLHTAGILSGLKTGGHVLVNSPHEAGALHLDAETYALPATQLAMQYLGRPVPNTALLAAFLALTGLLPLEALEQALAERFSGETLGANVRLVKEAVQKVARGAWRKMAYAASA